MKFEMIVTFSKLLALLSLICGVALSIFLKDTTAFNTSIGVVMVIVTTQNLGKNYVAARTNSSK